MNASSATAEALLSSIARSHGPELLRFFARKVANAFDAQDLVQEVYLRLLKVERPELIRCPRAYVYRTAANLAREHWLKRSSRPVHVALEETAEHSLPSDVNLFDATSPEEAVTTAESLGRLTRLLSQLPPKVSASLLWAHRDGHSYEEISARLSVSTSMVKKYLTKGMAHCRELERARARRSICARN